jgi:hypothetical protein
VRQSRGPAGEARRELVVDLGGVHVRESDIVEGGDAAVGMERGASVCCDGGLAGLCVI